MIKPFINGALAALASLVVVAPASAAEAPREVVFQWNELAVSWSGAALGAFRQQAMVHVAMFDAVNSIERRFEPYHVLVATPRSASSEAAAAQAAHDVLTALFPPGKPAFDAALEDRLATIQPVLRAQGVEVGQRAAQAVLEWRTADGSANASTPWLPPALPGLWQPDPSAPGQLAAYANVGGIKPFALLTATQFLPPAPPLLNSTTYRDALDEVKEWGAANSGVRSAEQTQLARMFNGGGIWSPSPFGMWSQVARKAADARDLSLVDTARLFAMVTVATNDGLQTSHTSKYVYALWRPVTAIRRADEDGNPGTSADPTWLPLLSPTPPYPSHASNIACVFSSAARAMARGLGTDELPFTVEWTGTNANSGAKASRDFTSFSQLAEAAGLSRIHGGIHFRFEIEASNTSCPRVGDWLADHFMQPVN